jgi:hypothetical protein
LYTRPISYYWNQWYGAKGVILIDEAKVGGSARRDIAQLTKSQFYLGVGIINLFGDMCILAVPISSVLKLHMGRTQKIAICFTFLLGSL